MGQPTSKGINGAVARIPTWLKTAIAGAVVLVASAGFGLALSTTSDVAGLKATAKEREAEVDDVRANMREFKIDIREVRRGVDDIKTLLIQRGTP